VGLFRGPDGPFTQEDPIGIAGGLNLYGYAGSDPINFSDPLGLCRVCDWLKGVANSYLAWRANQEAHLDAQFAKLDQEGGLKPGTSRQLIGLAIGATGGLEAGGAASAPAAEATTSTGFIVSSDGVALPVPEGASGPTATEGPGFQQTGGTGGRGLDSRVTGVRVMDATPQNPLFRASYMNVEGQTVNPFTGHTVSKADPWWHIPMRKGGGE